MCCSFVTDVVVTCAATCDYDHEIFGSEEALEVYAL
jgi:hypothetical protein